MNSRLSSSMEDYLKTIHLLKMDRGVVRVKDIAGSMAITMPSVSSALKQLEKQHLVWHSRYEWVDLTDEGLKVASNVCRRHNVIKHFLSEILGINPVIAEKDACGMEHSISPETLERLVEFVESGAEKPE